MFTGIIQEVGKVASARPREGGLELQIVLGSLAKAIEGDSIAVCGTCLTVERVKKGVGTFFLSGETLDKTWLGKAKEGDSLNLEPAMKLQDVVGGHLVSGHVDAIGKVFSRKPEGEGETLTVEVPENLIRFLLYKGSIALDGVSLTIAAAEGNRASFAIIPFTLEKTNLGRKQAGDPVNLEADMIGKWVEKLLPGK